MLSLDSHEILQEHKLLPIAEQKQTYEISWWFRPWYLEMGGKEQH